MNQSNSRPLRQKILQEAVGILYREGVDRITMRGLADRLGHSPAGIYAHFQSKDELVQEIAMYGFERLATAIRPAVSLEDPLEAWREAGRRYIEFGLSNGELYRLMFQQLPPDSFEPGLAPRRPNLTWGLYLKLHRRGVEQGAFRDVDPNRLIASGWAALHGFVLLALSERIPPPAAPSTALAEVRDTVLDERVRAVQA